MILFHKSLSRSIIQVKLHKRSDEMPELAIDENALKGNTDGSILIFVL